MLCGGGDNAARRGPVADRLIGDGLVPLHSALGHHPDAGRCLAFDTSAQWIAYRTSHVQLLNNPAVTQQMIHWLTPPA